MRTAGQACAAVEPEADSPAGDGTARTAETAAETAKENPPAIELSDAANLSVPAYLRDVYAWAYLNPVSRAIFDQSFVVWSILWGNVNRLIRAVLEEIEPGQRVLQTACVYGNFSNQLAERVGPNGRLEVIDVAPIQVRYTREKLRDQPQATVRLADAALPSGRRFDVVCCFFLLHEVPPDYKRRIVDALLDSVEPGGKVVFVDYHRPEPWHPLKGPMSLVFKLLEPFAREIWDEEIADYAEPREGWQWEKDLFFGGLYQKVVARRP
jgi:SAM-dependent methyltransferase